MTPVSAQTHAAAIRWEVRLAEQAAAKLAASLPEKSTPQIVEDLLARLTKKRKRREAQGLDHWESYCPRYLERLVVKCRPGDPLRQIVRFIVFNHGAAVEFANRITCDPILAEIAVSDTYLELLEGRTTVPLFYRALKMNARDLLARRATERKRTAPLGKVRSSNGARGTELGEESVPAYEAQDFPSERLGDKDPLEILLIQEEQTEHDELVRAAMRDPRWRYIKRLKWARSLLKCADLAPSRE